MRIQRWRELFAPLGPTLVDGRWRVDEDEGLSIEMIRRGVDEVDLRIAMPLSETITALRIMPAAEGLAEAGRIETGDAELDSLAWLFTSEIGTFGALSEHTRRLLVELLQRGATFVPGAIVLEPWATTALAAEKDAASAIAGALQDMVRLSQALVVPKGEVPYVRIGKIAQSDPDPAVRLAFARLAKRFPEVQNASQRLVAKHAKVADEATFEALVAVVADPGASSQVQREVWTKLLQLFPIGRVAPLFDVMKKGTADLLIGLTIARARDLNEQEELWPYAHALLTLIGLRHGKPEQSAAINAAQFFQRAMFPPAIPWLARCLEPSLSIEVKRAALAALLVMRVPADEAIAAMTESGLACAVDQGGAVAEHVCMQQQRLGPLIAALFERVQPLINGVADYLIAFRLSGDPAYADAVVPYLESETELVRDNAIMTLGAIGSMRHVRLLTPFTKGFFRSVALKEKAIVAIDDIERRAPDAAEGGLTLSEGGDGGLALADDDR